MALRQVVLVGRSTVLGKWLFSEYGCCLAGAVLTRENVGFDFSRCVDCSGDYQQATVSFWLWDRASTTLIAGFDRRVLHRAASLLCCEFEVSLSILSRHLYA